MLDNKWLTLSEAAAITGYTDSYLRRLLREGVVVGQKFSPRLWLIEKRSVEKLAKKPRGVGRPRSGGKK